MARIVVVLPAPLGPRNPTTWPAGTSNERSFNATMAPYERRRPWSSSRLLTFVPYADGPPDSWGAAPGLLSGCNVEVRHHQHVQEIPPLPVTTILLVEVGSTAHGTGLPGGEDHDELGVVVEQPGGVLGLAEGGYGSVMQRSKPEGSRSGPGDTDRTLHSLRRFVRLAASGNPSILMALWAPVIFSTPEGDELQGLGEAFVGRHVIPRYRGLHAVTGRATARNPE